MGFKAREGRKEPKGIYLMEVFDMVYLGHDKIPPEEQHGSIKLISDKGFQYLYNIPEEAVDFSNPPIKHMDDLIVTAKGPACCFEEKHVEFDLFAGAYNGTVKCNYDLQDLFYSGGVLSSERRFQSTDGTGEISVLLGLYANATVANLDLKLLNKSDDDTDVYGVVAASNSKLDRLKSTSVLFKAKVNYEKKLGPDGMIPLSKTSVAVPLDSVLYVDVNLHVNGKPYKANLALNAKCNKVSNAYDSTASPKFQLIVKWDASKESIISKYDSLSSTHSL